MHRSLRHLVKRCFSTEAQLVTPDHQSTRFSKLSSGLKIATTNEGSNATRLALLVNTGCRDDNASQLGLTHCLQASSGLTSHKNTAFLSTQMISSLGADLQVTAGRDHIVYSINCIETAANELISNVLVSSVLSAKFPEYDLKDEVKPRMVFQKAYAENDPLYVLMQSIHEASFRGAFANPVLSPDNMLGKHTSEMLISRFNAAFTLNNMVLAGSGINHEALCEIGSNIDGLPTGGGSNPLGRSRANFISSERHVARPGNLSYAALGFEGVALNDHDAIALSVLQQVLGTESSVKGGTGLANGILNGAIARKTEAPCSMNCFSVNYSDCGLFGVSLVASNNDISELVQLTSSTLEQVAKDGVTDNAVQAAKLKLKTHVLMESSVADYADELAFQALVLDNVVAPQQIVAIIDKITRDDIVSVAQRVLGGKKSLATVGRNTCFLQDL